MASNGHDDGRDIPCRIAGFITQVWGKQKRPCFGFVASSRPNGSGWNEYAIDMSDPMTGISDFLRRNSWKDRNLFFCPNPYSRPSRKKELALSTHWAWCDMDASQWRDYEPFPSLCWKTSPGRYQGLWLWDKRHARQEAETFSRSLAYRHGGDKNGWSITKMLRAPESINHKPEYNRPTVKLVHHDWRPVAGRSRPFQHALGDGTGSRLSVRPNRHNPDEVVEKYRRRLKHYTVRLIEHERVVGRDRSARIFEIVVALHHAGATSDEIAAVLWQNVYFLSKHGQSPARLDAEISRILSKLEGGK
jgi:hypothetical protein